MNRNVCSKCGSVDTAIEITKQEELLKSHILSSLKISAHLTLISTAILGLVVMIFGLAPIFLLCSIPVLLIFFILTLINGGRNSNLTWIKECKNCGSKAVI